ncbi:hypothetical protein D3C76_1346950 [compost metagenome]
MGRHALADQAQLFQGLAKAEHADGDFTGAEQQRRHQQLQLAALAGDRCQHHAHCLLLARQLQTLQHPSTQETVEEQPFTGLAEGFVGTAQLLPDRHKDVLECHQLWITAEYLAIDLLQTTLIKCPDRLAQLRLPLNEVGL